jgi:hypothetical protein
MVKEPAMAFETQLIRSFRVDLKWSLWTRFDDERWNGAYQLMQIMAPGCSVEISTAPRKEIRYGRVLVARLFPSMWVAEGVFTCGWDDPEDLACTLDTDCDDAFCEMLPYSLASDGTGVDNEFSVKANTFEKLMRRIDAEEDRCMQMSKDEWNCICSIFDKPECKDK